jgi:hypothetical protein
MNRTYQQQLQSAAAQIEERLPDPNDRRPEAKPQANGAIFKGFPPHYPSLLQFPPLFEKKLAYGWRMMNFAH